MTCEYDVAYCRPSDIRAYLNAHVNHVLHINPCFVRLMRTSKYELTPEERIYRPCYSVHNRTNGSSCNRNFKPNPTTEKTRNPRWDFYNREHDFMNRILGPICKHHTLPRTELFFSERELWNSAYRVLRSVIFYSVFCFHYLGNVFPRETNELRLKFA